jgi:hypothetical protein
MSPRFCVKAGSRIIFLATCLWLLLLPAASARTPLNPNDPVGFFTTLADKMLWNTFGFGVTNIPVYVNGQLVYSPAVNRILQLAANIYDASTNSFYPDVFRPIFEHDNQGNVYIVGYTNVSSPAGPNTVSGTDDQQFLAPLDVEALPEMGPDFTPITEGGNLVNVYEVPWIIGAKKYLPGFDQLSLLNTVTVDRRLQVARSYADGPIYTNHMYLLSISNCLGASFWNSYSNDYSSSGSGLSVLIADYLQLTLTNSEHPGINSTLEFTNSLYYATNLWPGSRWSQAFGEVPDNNSFITAAWTNTFFSNIIYKTGAMVFAQPTDPDPWESNNTYCDPLPQFGLITTNWLRAIILDNRHVVDYVQVRGPIDGTNFTALLADPNTTSQPYLWSTNSYGGPVGPSWGYVNQILISTGVKNAPADAAWQPANYPGDAYSIAAGEAYFNAFFNPPPHEYTDAFGNTAFNTNLVVQAGYIATRTVFVSYLYQVNDPLVHYLASDLNAGPFAYWDNGALPNGIWEQKNGVAASYQIPIPPYGADILRGHYQAWGIAAPAALQSSTYNFGNPYNLVYKDPGVWSPDYWDFPTNLLADLTGLGQVHRGTPWQTLYLKADDVLNPPGSAVGTNTWTAWTGDYNVPDAVSMAPVNDWHLASLIIALLSTNNFTQLMSVNDPNLTDWLSALDGLTISTNSAILPNHILPSGYPFPAATLTGFVMSSNSPQAGSIANAIIQARGEQPNNTFTDIGEILSVSDLTEDSPWLNTTNAEQLDYGITDAAYEAIPAQLLLRLRPDSTGAVYLTNGGVNLQFSGGDALSYELQQSPDLVNWISISTNSPVQGSFNFVIPSTQGSAQWFYRSVLLP